MDQQEIVDQLARLEAEITRLREERIPHVDRSSRRRDRRLTLAYVLVTAVIVGFTSIGTASALDGSDTVFSDDIVDGTVTSLDLKNNHVITSDIKDNSIASRDIADGAISGGDVADGSLTGRDIDLFNDDRCTLETILGTAVINADPAVPSTPNHEWVGWDHSCSGETVTVGRVGTGIYSVNFGSSNGSRLAVATVSEQTTDIVIPSVSNPLPGYFIVYLRTAAGFHVDIDFQILAY